MVKSGFVCFVFMVFVLGTLAAQDQRGAEKSHQVVLKYLGTAGWEITDGTTFVLIDPYLSRINGPPPPGGHPMAGDTRRAYGWDDVASPDVAAIDAHIQHADFVLVTHTHYDHILDVPHIALKTRAAVIGTETSGRLMRALHHPAIVLPTHWDNFLAPYSASQQANLDALHSFVEEFASASPKTKVIVPKYFEAISLETAGN